MNVVDRPTEPRGAGCEKSACPVAVVAVLTPATILRRAVAGDGHCYSSIDFNAGFPAGVILVLAKPIVQSRFDCYTD